MADQSSRHASRRGRGRLRRASGPVGGRRRRASPGARTLLSAIARRWSPCSTTTAWPTPAGSRRSSASSPPTRAGAGRRARPTAPGVGRQDLRGRLADERHPARVPRQLGSLGRRQRQQLRAAAGLVRAHRRLRRAPGTRYARPGRTRYGPLLPRAASRRAGPLRAGRGRPPRARHPPGPPRTALAVRIRHGRRVRVSPARRRPLRCLAAGAWLALRARVLLRAARRRWGTSTRRRWCWAGPPGCARAPMTDRLGVRPTLAEPQAAGGEPPSDGATSEPTGCAPRASRSSAPVESGDPADAARLD